MKFDVVAFGSATYDNYLLSKDFMLRKSEKGMMICEMYGAKITIEQSVVTTGGGATNAAVCFERLGLQSAVVGCIGRDYWGRIVRAKLREEGVSLIHLQVTEKLPTSSSTFLVGEDGGRTVLVYRAASNLLSEKQVDWDRLDAGWVYVSSLGGDFDLLRKIVLLAARKHIRIAFNPGSSELVEREKLVPFLSHINVLILNKEEMKALLNTRESLFTVKQVLAVGCEMVLVTNGKKGSCLYTKNGVFTQEIIKTKTIEETGAGDAFGSTFIAGLIKGLPTEKCLLLAAHNSSSVVGCIGPKDGLLFWPEARRLLSL